MKSVTHGVMVAGVSSAISAAWIRKRTNQAYDPTISPPSFRERLHKRTPLAIAGLGFTGLSAVVAQQFDRRELSILADHNSPIPVHQQLDKHRGLHSLPYVGSTVLAARLINNAGAEVGKWISKSLQLEDRASDIIDAIVDIADWVINSLGTGIIGHILGDLPTKGTLQLFKPISYDNFALKLIVHDNPTVNSYLQSAGWLLTGSAWAFAGLHLLSWKPPETRIQQYLEKLASQGSLSAAVGVILNDVRSLFARIVGRSREAFWNAPLFSKPSDNDTTPTQEPLWFDMEFDSESIWDIEEISMSAIIQKGIVPESINALLKDDSIYSSDPYDMDAPLYSIIDASEVGESIWKEDTEGSPLRSAPENETKFRSEPENEDSFRERK